MYQPDSTKKAGEMYQMPKIGASQKNHRLKHTPLFMPLIFGIRVTILGTLCCRIAGLRCCGVVLEKK
jgi:hypothetical protein